eukprot:1171808-Rhodomonas_salina.1
MLLRFCYAKSGTDVGDSIVLRVCYVKSSTEKMIFYYQEEIELRLASMKGKEKEVKAQVSQSVRTEG